MLTPENNPEDLKIDNEKVVNELPAEKDVSEKIPMSTLEWVSWAWIKSMSYFSINSEIAFRYRDYRDGREKLMRLAPAAFLDRWFEHVPPRGLRMIRRSGLYANCHAALRQRIRQRTSSARV